jgi:hypothetical protein
MSSLRAPLERGYRDHGLFSSGTLWGFVCENLQGQVCGHMQGKPERASACLTDQPEH